MLGSHAPQSNICKQDLRVLGGKISAYTLNTLLEQKFSVTSHRLSNSSLLVSNLLSVHQSFTHQKLGKI